MNNPTIKLIISIVCQFFIIAANGTQVCFDFLRINNLKIYKMETILKAEWDKFRGEEGVSIYPEEIPSPYKEIAIRAMQRVKNLNIPAVIKSLPEYNEILYHAKTLTNEQFREYWNEIQGNVL